jgi:hypothetical protein
VSRGLFECVTRDLRLEVMQDGVIGGYRLNVGEWEERFRIETTRPSADGVPVRPRGDHRGGFKRNNRSAGARS